MVKIVNIFKAAGLWVGTVFLLYGNKPVASSAARSYVGYGGQSGQIPGYGALAPTRSPELYHSTRSTSYRGGELALGTEFPIGGFKQGGGAVSRERSISGLRNPYPQGGFADRG